MFEDLGIQHATRLRHIVICDLSGFTLFFKNPISSMFAEKKSNWT